MLTPKKNVLKFKYFFVLDFDYQNFDFQLTGAISGKIDLFLHINIDWDLDAVSIDSCLYVTRTVELWEEML